MPLIILLLILAVPVVELSILIDIGGEIGALPTIALCILTAAVGLTIVRQQGLSTLRDIQTQGQRIGTSIVHGFFLALAGVCLLIPGFMTDIIGGLLLIPPLRLWLGKGIASWAMTHKAESMRRGNIVIEGEFWTAETKQPAPEPLPREDGNTDRPEN
ncbi:FxsA family protein [Kordiimonas aestuarii]|uniref:FxsA family protein n=1 Tax=Kordiimonas aestuarii TaxID=1005925 RepID=UPI0021CFBAC5|nr:FxsA family protein [Kordiimonas aestuarii]